MNQKELLEKFNAHNKNTLMEVLDISYTDIGEDYLTARMPVNSKVFQPLGQLHGGATAALAETVASMAANYFIANKDEYVNGLELTINHIKSKRSGEIFATAKCIHSGKSTQLWEVNILDEEGSLIAVAKMTSIVLKKR